MSQSTLTTSHNAPSHHPLDPLTATEILLVSNLLKSSYPSKRLHFKIITILEPPKALLRPYLIAERSSSPSTAPTPLPRIASALFYHLGTSDLFLAEVNVRTSKIEKCEKLAKGLHGQNDMDEVIELRDACLSDERVVRYEQA